MTENFLFIWKAFDTFADHTLFINSGKTITYDDFFKDVITTTKKIEPFSIVSNERVALVVDNSYESIRLLFALWYKGAVPVLLSERIPAQQVTKYMASIDCSKMISKDIIPELYRDDIMTEHTSLTIEDSATIVFTSGTSTVPKAVLHTYGNHYYSALGSNQNIQLHPGDRWLLSLPLNHVGGLSILFRCLIAGATIVIKGDTDSVAGSIEENRITHLSLVETQLKQLLEEKNISTSSLKALLVGGGSISRSVIQKAVDQNLPILTTYGMTEMASQITTTPSGSTGKILRTSGKVLPYREIKISNDSEILVRGETLCIDYLNEKFMVDSGGWFHTGDIGHLDDGGYLTVTGRTDNMFISGGENIHPEQIEQFIRELPEIMEAVVVPKEDKKFGMIPIVFYSCHDDRSVTGERLKEFLLDKLPGFQIPKMLYPFPDTYKPLGIKPDRKFLRQWLKNNPL